MKQLLVGVLLLFAVVAAEAQALYNSGTSIFIGPGATVQVNGNLVNNTGTFTNNGTLTTTGNITNNATMAIPAAGLLQLNGTTAQTLSGTSPVMTQNLVMNNAAGVTLATPLRIDGSATFTSGIINAANRDYPMLFTANGLVSGTATDASHVNGYVVKEGTGAFTFPVGNTTNYQPIDITLTANSGGMRALYVPSDAGAAPYGTSGTESTPLVQYNSSEYWDLTPVGTATGAVTIYYDSYRATPISNNTSDLRVAHKYNEQWLNEGRATGSTGNSVSGTIISNSISAWSLFTFGVVSPVILPVQLTSFTAIKQGNSSLLTWTVAQENNIASYTIERSTDGRSFAPVGSIASLGNTITVRSYNFTDANPAKGTNHYRIKTVERDGKTSYSDVRLLNFGSQITIALYPNPVKNKATLTGVEAGMSIRLLDAVGKVLQVQKAIGTMESIVLNSFAKGSYFVQVHGTDGTLLNTTQVVKE